MFGENRRQLEEEKMPSCFNDHLDYLEVENLFALKITLEVPVYKLMILCQKIIYEKSSHHKSIFRPDYGDYAACRNANLYFIADHFDCARDKLLLKEFFKHWYLLLICTYRRRLIKKLIFNHELAKHRGQVLLHALIELV